MLRVLYISPVLPRRRGYGLEQRAYRVIEALSHRYRVSLLTTMRADPNGVAAMDARSLCDDVIVLALHRWTAPALRRRALRRFFSERYDARSDLPSDWTQLSGPDQRWLSNVARNRFDVVHVHRLLMLPLLHACPALADVPAWLDLDDIESITRGRLAELAWSNGDRKTARVMRRDADRYRAIEQRELARFDRVFVCSETDRATLLDAERMQRVGVLRNVDVLPNVVEIEEGMPRGPRRSDGPFVFLFVGTMGYYANRDAVEFFCREVAPRIRERVAAPFEIRIVSDAIPKMRPAVPHIPELSLAPPGADLSREYNRADVVIVPIRAGGGTRIKVLEAFARRAPVISTAIGVEGLDVVHGEHALIGETAAELAAHAVAVTCDAALRDRLRERAFALVQAKYTPAALHRHMGEIMDETMSCSPRGEFLPMITLGSSSSDGSPRAR